MKPRLRTTSQSGLRPPRPGCGTQHPQRFACVLLAAAPTTTPCFRHWRRSSLLPLVGEPLAKRLSFAKCQRLSLWESWREAPERARPLAGKHRHSDSIALTKSLPIAAQRLFRAGLALSVIASQCHLSHRERLSSGADPIKCITLLPVGHTAQRKEGLFVQTFYKICLILMIVGGINWGLVGLFQFDFVGWLLGGSASIWSRIVFTLVGVAAVCGIPGLFTDETGE